MNFANSFINCKTLFSLDVDGLTTATCGGLGSLDGTDSIVVLIDGISGTGGFWSTSVFSGIWLTDGLIVDTAYVKKI